MLEIYNLAANLLVVKTGEKEDKINTTNTMNIFLRYKMLLVTFLVQMNISKNICIIVLIPSEMLNILAEVMASGIPIPALWDVCIPTVWQCFRRFQGLLSVTGFIFLQTARTVSMQPSRSQGSQLNLLRPRHRHSTKNDHTSQVPQKHFWSLHWKNLTKKSIRKFRAQQFSLIRGFDKEGKRFIKKRFSQVADEPDFVLITSLFIP